jgi:hypothetical protein
MRRIILLFLFLGVAGCTGQEKSKETPEKQAKEKKEMPEGKWQVNKEFDEFGNLKRYDSIYSYSYSKINGDSVAVNLDSIMNSFRGFFNERSPFEWKDQFSYFPGPDSLFMKDFFADDYFLKRWERQHYDLEDMMKKMDSARNAFLRQYHPGLLESKDHNE